MDTRLNQLPSFIERKCIYEQGDCQAFAKNHSDIVSDFCFFDVFKGFIRKMKSFAM